MATSKTMDEMDGSPKVRKLRSWGSVVVVAVVRRPPPPLLVAKILSLIPVFRSRLLMSMHQQVPSSDGSAKSPDLPATCSSQAMLLFPFGGPRRGAVTYLVTNDRVACNQIHGAWLDLLAAVTSRGFNIRSSYLDRYVELQARKMYSSMVGEQ